MKNPKQNPEKVAECKSRLPEPARLHEKNDEDKMEDFYREKENRGTVEAA